MASIDHTAVKSRIESILEANSALYDASSTDGTKLTSIEPGFPFNNDLIPQIIPSAFIYKLSEINRQRGSRSGEAIVYLEHEVRYNIAFLVAETTSKVTETQLDTFEKAIIETLSANIQLKSGGSDPLCDTSFPERIDLIRQNIGGKWIQGRTITLKCTMTTN